MRKLTTENALTRWLCYLCLIWLSIGAGTAFAASAAPPASAASASATAPIEANGLTAQLLRLTAQWVDGLAEQLGKLEHAVTAMPAFLRWLSHTFGTPDGQAMAIKAATALAAVFVIGLALEWTLRWTLRRPRRALVDHAELADRRVIDRERREALARQQRLELAQAAEKTRAEADAATPGDASSAGPAVPAPDSPVANAVVAGTMAASAAAAGAASSRSKPAAPPGAPKSPATTGSPAATTAAGATGAPGDVALMRTQVDGTERVEAVSVGAGDGASGAAAVDAIAAAAESNASDDAAELPPEPRPVEHWRTLRHLPYAIGALVLDLLPLLLFFIAAGLVLRWVAGETGPVRAMTEGYIDAYLTTRVTMAVVRLLVSPVGHGLQVLRVSAATSDTVQAWVRRIIVLGSFGIALSNGAGAFGASHDGQVAFMKLVSLFAHTCTVILIFRVRRPVGELIAARPGAVGAVASVRHWLAEVWAFYASFVVMAIWVVWALGVENGFQKLIHFIAVSLGVIVAARLLAILLLGGLGRLFHQREEQVDDGSARHRLAQRYYPILRSVITALIVVATAIALLEVWGFDAIAWFARGGVGRSLTSAALTIFVAALIAIAVWESANLAVERRLARWTDRGDTVRAARLRTLLPMLRSCLFVAIVLIVGLTALNEIGINTTPLLAGASIIGVALGFGSQKLVQDFITGIFLLMENAMQVGDWVTVAGLSGSVEYLSIRTVRLRAGDGSLYIVPFSSVSTVNNTNRGIGNAAVRVSVPYDSDIDRVIDELKHIGVSIRTDPNFRGMTLGDLELWGVDSVDGAMVTIAGQIRCRDSGRWGVQREFNRRMFLRFRDLGIEMANPRESWVMPMGAWAGSGSEGRVQADRQPDAKADGKVDGKADRSADGISAAR